MSGACGSSDPATGDDDQSAGALAFTSAFAMTPGIERLKQHKSTGDLIGDQKAALDLRNAYWLARMSQLAYQSETELKASLAALGLETDADHFRWFENRCSDTQAFYVTTASLADSPADLDRPYAAASPAVAVLAFRGTEPKSWSDIGTDLFAWNRPNTVRAGNVHAGFLQVLDSVWKKDERVDCQNGDPIGPFVRAHHSFDGRSGKPVRKGAELYFTGHSLGAALATLALTKTAIEQCDLEGGNTDSPCFSLYTPVSGLFTYGSPRVGNLDFANSMARWMQDRTPIYRFVHGRDVVTNVPGTTTWRHLGFDGEEKTFKVQIGDSPLRMIVGDDGDRGNGSIVDDHASANYVNVLQKLDAR